MKVKFHRKNDRLVDVYIDEIRIKANVLHHVKSCVDQRGVILYLHSKKNDLDFSNFIFETDDIKMDLQKKFLHLL